MVDTDTLGTPTPVPITLLIPCIVPLTPLIPTAPEIPEVLVFVRDGVVVVGV